jgi:hypothetical protein
MSLADAVLESLRGFAAEVSTWTNQGSLTSISSHIAQIESAAATDLHAGETAAKAVLGELYGAFHGHQGAEPGPTPPAAASAPQTASTSSATTGTSTPVSAPSSASASGSPAQPAPTMASEPGPEVTVPDTGSHVDPTPAPGTTGGASSAPSNTPSASTDTPAAPTAPTA